MSSPSPFVIRFNDQSFELAFSNIAHAFLRSRAPGLLDHEIGFQVIDTSDDNKKAVGVFAFKVGSQWVFAPVFFLSGDLKGYELLYLKNQDMFVPLSEAWINYLLNRKPNLLGDSVSRNSRSLGVVPPDMSQLARAPYKRASATKQEIAVAFEHVTGMIADTVTTSTASFLEKMGQELNLAAFLKQASLPALERLVSWCYQNPTIGAGIEEFHGLNTISEAIKLAGQRARMAKSGSILDSPPPPRPIFSGFHSAGAPGASASH